MSFQSSDFLPVYRNGEPYKATANELKEYVQTGLDFAVTDHTHDEYISKEADNSTYKDWLLKADGNKKNPTDFASSNHSHSGYASSSHTHSGYASSSHSHSGYASSSHNHNSSYVKGNYTISKSNGNWYIS
jgi:hypothetical protein